MARRPLKSGSESSHRSIRAEPGALSSVPSSCSFKSAAIRRECLQDSCERGSHGVDIARTRVTVLTRAP